MKKVLFSLEMLGFVFLHIFNAVTGVCLKEQHGICTVDLATSPTLSTAQIFCGLPSIKNRITKEKYSTPEPLVFSDALQEEELAVDFFSFHLCCRALLLGTHVVSASLHSDAHQRALYHFEITWLLS